MRVHPGWKPGSASTVMVCMCRRQQERLTFRRGSESLMMHPPPLEYEQVPAHLRQHSCWYSGSMQQSCTIGDYEVLLRCVMLEVATSSSSSSSIARMWLRVILGSRGRYTCV